MNSSLGEEGGEPVSAASADGEPIVSGASGDQRESQRQKKALKKVLADKIVAGMPDDPDNPGTKLTLYYALPLQGRPERKRLYGWMVAEEEYVAKKFDDQQDGHDEGFKNYDIDIFWIRQIVQYLDRARVFLDTASETHSPATRRFMELKAQQALAKCMMTAKGCVESSIRVYGPLPKGGVPSGEIEAR